VSKSLQSPRHRIVYPRLTQKSIEIQAQESIAQAAKKSPGAKTEPKCDRTSGQNFPGVEVDRFPILTGIAFSDKFLARYSPPQPEISYKADADGQLSLLVFEVSELEPPDPDDFESLDAFQQAIARWDCEYPEELATSLDSMCEWAPCPADWYEPDTELEPSLVLDVLLAIELPKLLDLPRDLELPKLSELLRASELSELLRSITNFCIPTFGAFGDLINCNCDEPPTSVSGARLTKPKRGGGGFPSVSPQTPLKLNLNAYQTQPKRIPIAILGLVSN
jgi:hypothetical protein